MPFRLLQNYRFCIKTMQFLRKTAQISCNFQRRRAEELGIDFLWQQKKRKHRIGASSCRNVCYPYSRTLALRRGPQRVEQSFTCKALLSSGEGFAAFFPYWQREMYVPQCEPCLVEAGLQMSACKVAYGYAHCGRNGV